MDPTRRLASGAVLADAPAALPPPPCVDRPGAGLPPATDARGRARPIRARARPARRLGLQDRRGGRLRQMALARPRRFSLGPLRRTDAPGVRTRAATRYGRAVSRARPAHLRTGAGLECRRRAAPLRDLRRLLQAP